MNLIVEFSFELNVRALNIQGDEKGRHDSSVSAMTSISTLINFYGGQVLH